MEVSERILHLHFLRSRMMLHISCSKRLTAGVIGITPAVNRLLTIVASPTDYCGIAAHSFKDAACVLHHLTWLPCAVCLHLSYTLAHLRLVLKTLAVEVNNGLLLDRIHVVLGALL